jgi:recombination protein RecA
MTDFKKLFSKLEDIGVSCDSRIESVASFSSGVWNIDALTGIRGYPVGRIIELFGGEMSGKSYLAMRAVASMQRKLEEEKSDARCVYIDIEQSFDPVWAKSIGIDINKLLILRPDYAEQALETAKIMTEGSPLIIIDSTAALLPKSELEGTIEESNVGVLARVMSKALRVLVQAAANNKCTIIFINQLREKIPMAGRPIFGDSTDTPGGRALKFYSSVRLRVERRSIIKSGDGRDSKPVGHMMDIKIVKNKCGSPMGSVTLPFYYDKGIDDRAGIIDFAIDNNVISRNGSKYTYGTHSWVGYDALYKGIDLDELMRTLEKK